MQNVHTTHSMSPKYEFVCVLKVSNGRKQKFSITQVKKKHFGKKSNSRSKSFAHRIDQISESLMNASHIHWNMSLSLPFGTHLLSLNRSETINEINSIQKKRILGALSKFYRNFMLRQRWNRGRLKAENRRNKSVSRRSCSFSWAS